MARQAELKEDDNRSLRRMMALLGLFRGYDGEMPVQQMLCFVWVALNEGKMQRDLIAALDMHYSSVSRNIAALSTVHRLGKPGLGLITWLDDPLDRRAKQLVLTPAGRAFIRQLLGFLDP